MPRSWALACDYSLVQTYSWASFLPGILPVSLIPCLCLTPNPGTFLCLCMSSPSLTLSHLGVHIPVFSCHCHLLPRRPKPDFATPLTQ